MAFKYDAPIYLQIIHQLKEDIISGKLNKGDKLMSTRELAIQLQVNPNTTQKSYRVLESEGICYTKHGIGTFITEDEAILNAMRKSFVDEMVEAFMNAMSLLNYSMSEIIESLHHFEALKKEDENHGSGN